MTYIRREQQIAYQRAWFDRRHPPRVGTWRRSVAEIDPVVVDRLVGGDRPEFYTAFERREAARRLVASGVSKREAARVLGIHHRQVYRDLRTLAELDARVVPLPIPGQAGTVEEEVGVA